MAKLLMLDIRLKFPFIVLPGGLVLLVLLHNLALALFELGVPLLGVCELSGQLLNVLYLLRDVVVQLPHFSGMLQVLLLEIILHAAHFLLQTEDFLVDLLCTGKDTQITQSSFNTYDSPGSCILIRPASPEDLLSALPSHSLHCRLLRIRIPTRRRRSVLRHSSPFPELAGFQRA